MELSVPTLDLANAKGVVNFHNDRAERGRGTTVTSLPPKPKPRSFSAMNEKQTYESVLLLTKSLHAPAKPLLWGHKNVNKRECVSVSLDNFETAPRIKAVFNTPRSVKACSLAAVNPRDLLRRQLSDFMGHGVPENLVQMRYTYYESRRNAKIAQVRQIRDSIPVTVSPEVNGQEEQSSPDNVDDGRIPKGRASSCELNKPPVRRSISNGAVSRSSSVAYKTGVDKTRTSSRRSTIYGSDGRSASTGVVKVLNRIMGENRSPSTADYDMMKRIEEREERANEVKQRADEMEASRQRALVLKELKKEVKGINKLIERENEKNNAVKMRRQKLDIRLLRARERQKRSEQERLNRISSQQ
uniref:WGS project CAEQ00000000 data, annotated contig 1163 n=1 Tax=Trypanosoma congolense (strain IL3000) TaxID=1068625 RepID=F9W4A7_TRYCI|nr:unnamed protein product [Trypanosoma congolense IL3000]